MYPICEISYIQSTICKNIKTFRFSKEYTPEPTTLSTDKLNIGLVLLPFLHNPFYLKILF